MIAYPPSAPPAITPESCTVCSRKQIPAVLSDYLRTYIYVWIERGHGFTQGFWMYPTGLSRGVALGYLWHNRRWHYVRVDINYIDRFF